MKNEEGGVPMGTPLFFGWLVLWFPVSQHYEFEKLSRNFALVRSDPHFEQAFKGIDSVIHITEEFKAACL